MEISPSPPTRRAPSRAAQYVRMSTEHQQYSPQNQTDVVQQYAASHNMDIVREYSDHGRSGLNIAGRDGLNQLMSDVEAKRTDFTSLLVYDVSRWGRFQDVDESAYFTIGQTTYLSRLLIYAVIALERCVWAAGLVFMDPLASRIYELPRSTGAQRRPNGNRTRGKNLAKTPFLRELRFSIC
jgi:Resolvase, N terminal domain